MNAKKIFIALQNFDFEHANFRIFRQIEFNLLQATAIRHLALFSLLFEVNNRITFARRYHYMFNSETGDCHASHGLRVLKLQANFLRVISSARKKLLAGTVQNVLRGVLLVIATRKNNLCHYYSYMFFFKYINRKNNFLYKK